MNTVVCTSNGTIYALHIPTSAGKLQYHNYPPCLIFQSTYNPTGVYWNYEASPAAKARLQALLNRSSDEDDEPVRPPTPPENHTPAIKLRLRPTLYREADDEATRWEKPLNWN